MIVENVGRKSGKMDLWLIIYALYIIYLVLVLITTRNIWLMVYAHILIVILFSLLYFGRDYLYILISPVWVIVFPFQSFLIKRHLKNFTQNIPMETVVILAHSDWLRLQSWMNPNYFCSELEVLAEYLKKKGSKFSFYTNATIDDVYKIMGNKDIKEVYFYGHGTSHMFQLSSYEMLYYCDFNNRNEYGKDFVHQVHCGTSHGKSLIDYVVPDGNKSKCFIFKKPITAIEIKKEFKKRMVEEVH